MALVLFRHCTTTLSAPRASFVALCNDRLGSYRIELKLPAAPPTGAAIPLNSSCRADHVSQVSKADVCATSRSTTAVSSQLLPSFAAICPCTHCWLASYPFLILAGDVLLTDIAPFAVLPVVLYVAVPAAPAALVCTRNLFGPLDEHF